MAVHRRYDILIIVGTVGCLLAYASIRTEFRLRVEMPREFFDEAAVSRSRAKAEEQVARAYWKCAVTQIQWEYGYAHRLPDSPPASFVINAEAGNPAEDHVLRQRYWQKLRAVWGISGMWQQQYEWNMISLKESLQSAGDWLEQHVRRIVGYS